jgi:hypothetical protein
MGNAHLPNPQDPEPASAGIDNKSSTKTEKKFWLKTAFLLVGLVILLLVNILFIVDTELTLKRNAAYQGKEEREWGFGQILALLLLVVPLRDAWIALRNIKNNTQQRFDQALRTIAEAGETVNKLVSEGALLSKVDFARFGNSLHYAAYHGSIDLIKFVLTQGVSLGLKGELAVHLFLA